MPASARRAASIVGAGVALLGVVLAVTGLWFAIDLGPSGAVRVTKAVPAAGALEITPRVLNAVDAPVDVAVTRADRGPLWAGVAAAGDVGSLLGSATRTRLTAVHYPSGRVSTTTAGATALPDLTASDVWRVTRQGAGSVRLTVDQGHGPESVVVASGGANPLGSVTATVTWHLRAWFYEALALLVLGVLLAGSALAYLWRHRPLWTAGGVAPRAEVPADGVPSDDAEDVTA